MAVVRPRVLSDDVHLHVEARPPGVEHVAVDDGQFGYEAVNVANQEFDPDSLFNWMQRLVHLRKENPEFGWGEFDLVETNPPGVMVHRCAWEGRSVVAVHNLADETADVAFSVPGDPRIADVFANRQYEPLDGESPEFTVDPYGYRWLRLGHPSARPDDSWENVDV